MSEFRLEVGQVTEAVQVTATAVQLEAQTSGMGATVGTRTVTELPLLGRDAIAGCDLVLVPALLVDRSGTRLGKGGGCYDRALSRTTGLTVALLHDHELVDVLPAEPHDVRVDAVATPSLGVVRLPAKM